MRRRPQGRPAHSNAPSEETGDLPCRVRTREQTVKGASTISIRRGEPRNNPPAGRRVELQCESGVNGLTRKDSSTTNEVLIVDDDATVLTILSETLTNAGYRCHTANNAKDALARAVTNEGVSVVLSDIYMPGMTGLQFIDRLTAQPLSRPCPRLLLLTAQPSLQTVVDALRLGVCDFLTKPVRTAELLSAVKRAMTRADADRRGFDSPITSVERLIREAQGLTEHLRQLAMTAQTAVGPVECVAGNRACGRPSEGRDGVVLETLEILRQQRARYASHKLDDVAWDLLLELARAERQGQRISVSGLMISGSSVSPTTLLRRINDLADREYVSRVPDPNDARRDFVALTPKARDLVSDFLEKVNRHLSDLRLVQYSVR